MTITSTYPRLRLVEAIVNYFAQDSTLISLTDDGEPDNYGSRHRIGEVLNEAALKGRTPYVGVQVVDCFPLIPGTARAHLFTSMVIIWTYSKHELRATELADRVQYILTTPGDDDCNGYTDFTNDYIKNVGTEFESRGAKIHDAALDLYAETIQFRVIWSDVPCSQSVSIPHIEECDLPQDSDPDLEGCITNLDPTDSDILESVVAFPETVAAFSAEGGTGPYTYTIVAGADRDLFEISGDSLEFTETPPLTVDDTYVVVIRVTDANGNYKDFDFLLTVIE